MLPKAPFHPLEYPNRPWDRVHIDNTGPNLGNLFLILVDAYSKWIETRIVKTTHSIPKHIVTDNGSGFTRHKFKDFTESNGIKYIFTSLITHHQTG